MKRISHLQPGFFNSLRGRLEASSEVQQDLCGVDEHKGPLESAPKQQDCLIMRTPVRYPQFRKPQRKFN